jgi:hypothetical protein
MFMRLLRMILLLAAVASSLAAPDARAESSARIVETQPASSATLGRQQSFWVRIEYQSDEPIRLWARPYRNGREVEKAMSNGSLKYVGSGEALGWFALTEPGEVDEIRINAGGGKPYREWELARESVELRWTDAPSAETRAEWVEELLATEEARRAEESKRRASEPVTAGETAFLNGFMLAVLALVVAGVGVPLWNAWKWRGAWRVAAAVPACAMLVVVLNIIVGTMLDPTSHNLWPFEILQTGVVALVIIGVLKLMRRWIGAPS